METDVGSESCRCNAKCPAVWIVWDLFLQIFSFHRMACGQQQQLVAECVCIVYPDSEIPRLHGYGPSCPELSRIQGSRPRYWTCSTGTAALHHTCTYKLTGHSQSLVRLVLWVCHLAFRNAQPVSTQQQQTPFQWNRSLGQQQLNFWEVAIWYYQHWDWDIATINASLYGPWSKENGSKTLARWKVFRG